MADTPPPKKNFCNKVPIEHRADVDRWLRDTLHPTDYTTLHMHFIDCNSPRDLTELYRNVTCPPTLQEKGEMDVEFDAKKMAKDMKALCLFTDGVLVSWSVEKGKHLHDMFEELKKDKDVNAFKPGSVGVTLGYVPKDGDPASETFPFDQQHHLRLESDNKKMAQLTQETFVTSSLKEGDKRPVVCVLIGGDEQSLKTAANAVKQDIPVIVMIGTGGFADLLAWLLEKSIKKYKKTRVQQKAKTISVRVVKDEIMSKIRSHFKKGNDEMQKAISSLESLINSLHLLTVYYPSATSSGKWTHGNLDETVLEALIKHNKASQIEMLLRRMKVRRPGVRVSSQSYSKTVIKHEPFKTELLIHLLRRCPSAVSAFLTHLQPAFVDFHLDRFLYLYGEEIRFLKKSDEKKEPLHRFIQARQDLREYMGHLSPFPLRCQGKDCKDCSISYEKPGNDDSMAESGVSCMHRGTRSGPLCWKACSGDSPADTNAVPMKDMEQSERLVGKSSGQAKPKDTFLQTCLHPVQELFLWALMSGQLDLSVAFWKYCDDKMAAALFAHALFMGIKDKENNLDVKNELEGYARRFEDLALRTLKAAHEVNKHSIYALIHKPCPWWGDLTVHELALLTKSKLFFSQPCYELLLLQWNGYELKGKKDENNSKPMEDEQSQDEYPAMTVKRQGLFERPQFSYHFTLVWQVAFLLLYSYVLLFDLSNDTPSYFFIALMVCVADTACEEFRQLLMSSIDKKGKGSFENKVKMYWSQKWNKLDVVSILCFVLGVTLVFIPNQIVHKVGRFVLAMDTFIFFLRFLQSLSAFGELGLLLVIAEKMVMDSLRFMGILLTVMLSYVVASESVLYPDMSFSLETLYRLPSKAFWQTFGEMGLEEIRGDDCETDGLCPSASGKYVVPVMVGLYVITSQVLLLNLLIAKFNTTFTDVQCKAEYHQAWQRCRLVQEYESRPFFPPPFNILVTTIKMLHTSCKNRTKDNPISLETVNLTDTGHKFSKVEISPCGKCLTLFPKTGNQTEQLNVKVTLTINGFDSQHTYEVPAGTKKIMVWRESPTMMTKIDTETLCTEPQYQTKYNENWRLQEFENEQALFVLSQYDTLDKKQCVYCGSSGATE